MSGIYRETLRLLREEPAAWKSDSCYMVHPFGLAVWTANGSYGMEIADGQFGPVLWGGVGFLSSFGLSWRHWRLWAAAKQAKDEAAVIRLTGRSA